MIFGLVVLPIAAPSTRFIRVGSFLHSYIGCLHLRKAGSFIRYSFLLNIINFIVQEIVSIALVLLLKILDRLSISFSVYGKNSLDFFVDLNLQQPDFSVEKEN